MRLTAQAFTCSKQWCYTILKAPSCGNNFFYGDVEIIKYLSFENFLAKSYNHESGSNSSKKLWANLKRNLTLFTSGPPPITTSYQSVSSKSPTLN